MKYHQLTFHERYLISKMRKQRFSQSHIARTLGRHRSTISREVKRNQVSNGSYVVQEAQWKTNGRRSRSRRNRQYSQAQFDLIIKYLKLDWSPEQITGTPRKQGLQTMSHETIYKYIWLDKKNGGQLHAHLRCSQKQRRRRRNLYESRGRVTNSE